MNRTTFIILALVVMALVGFYVRAGIDRTDPPKADGAPPTPHETGGAYSDCLNCHGNITDSHDEQFGAGSYSDCLSCHEPTS